MRIGTESRCQDNPSQRNIPQTMLRRKSMNEHRYELQILEGHLDTFMHVNNAVYFAILEEARWDLVTKNGYGMAEMQKCRQGPVLLEVSLRFKKELRLREKITIVTKPQPYRGKIGKIFQQMLKADGSIAAEAEFTVGFFDRNERKLIAPSKDWLRAIGVA